MCIPVDSCRARRAICIHCPPFRSPSVTSEMTSGGLQRKVAADVMCWRCEVRLKSMSESVCRCLSAPQDQTSICHFTSDKRSSHLDRDMKCLVHRVKCVIHGQSCDESCCLQRPTQATVMDQRLHVIHTTRIQYSIKVKGPTPFVPT